ncbi:hypothetical protein ISF_08681 [Cordyceps fumosorosea ARSEF 2679]|uniref:Uncharacterized protein n=1 Tax=Cordyceps fumosorosea (strain ARSEF 2679) TaxID=1081104 RepID=A0A167LZY1_CORFA|nr:hypothetical protein ISF_08681 [Cordyceps fumosorosea ARSEF 2679]OAA53742.1 hypothetical protein ISF_08681 [Cordyceps fumosorosea ARSEF 2679]
MKPALLLRPLLAALSSALPPVPPSSATALALRSGCNQSACPDGRFGLDLWSVWAHNFAWLTELRWRGECGCHAFAVDTLAGCKTFTICTGTHSVCLDWRAGRGHWIDPQGKKTCYSLKNDYVCGTRGWQAWPTEEVECTW